MATGLDEMMKIGVAPSLPGGTIIRNLEDTCRNCQEKFGLYEFRRRLTYEKSLNDERKKLQLL